MFFNFFKLLFMIKLKTSFKIIIEKFYRNKEKLVNADVNSVLDILTNVLYVLIVVY
jgi:hypothetical protein